VALTGPDGRYAFDAALPGRHLVVEVRHPAGGEAVTAIAPPRDGGRTTVYERRVGRVTPDGTLVTAAGKGQYAPGAFDRTPGPEAGLGETIVMAGDGGEGLFLVDQSETGAQRTSHLAADGTLTSMPEAPSVVFAGRNGEIWALQPPVSRAARWSCGRSPPPRA
jgi:hypothetical protein